MDGWILRMKFTSDDDIKRIDRRYLGPKGKLLPVRTSYRNWGISIAVIVCIVVLWSFLGLPVNKWTVAGACFGGLFLIIGIQSYLTDEVTVLSTLRMFYNEAQAPSQEHVEKSESVFLALYTPIYRDGMPQIRNKSQAKKFAADEKFDRKVREHLDRTRYLPYLES